jgi:choline kinase
VRNNKNIKAVILAAGVGSRISPLTDNCPKSLLTVGGRTILERMLTHIQSAGIRDVIMVLGYLEEQIKTYTKKHFPDLNISFITNYSYAATNTAFSLMMTNHLVEDSTFIKFDADVVFDKKILEKLIASEHANCLCIDKNIKLATEEIKVILGDQSKVLKASKTVDPAQAAGESIGIEKIDSRTTPLLFAELREMMKDPYNYQRYYESAYESLIEKNIPFHALDITGLKWTEIDTEEDLRTAETLFGEEHPNG